MANDVYANGREIACKKASGKAICAFPDVCFTPPQTPATPPGIPIPYPNTGMASDTTKGSKKTKISGKEIMLKNQSHFKTSYGDEAGCAPKKGLLTSKNKGKIYFTAWSMDVKVEGKNAIRHLDLTTHNHASEVGQTPPWPYVDTAAFGNVSGCEAEERRAKNACRGQTIDDCSDSCKRAQACILVPKGKDKKRCCAPNNTGHHMIEDHWVDGLSTFPMAQRTSGYNAAPCVCANASRFDGTHGIMHDVQGTFEESHMPGGSRHKPQQKSGGWNYGAGKEATLYAHAEAHPKSNCSDDCLEAQLDSFYGKDNRRALKEPSKQGIGGDRQELEWVWSDVLSNP